MRSDAANQLCIVDRACFDLVVLLWLLAGPGWPYLYIVDSWFWTVGLLNRKGSRNQFAIIRSDVSLLFKGNSKDVSA